MARRALADAPGTLAPARAGRVRRSAGRRVPAPGRRPGAVVSRPAGLCRGRDEDLAQLAAGRLSQGEDHGLRNVLGPVEVLVARRLDLLRPVVEERGLHVAWQEQRDADAVAALGRQRTREADDAELACAVG